MDGAWGAVNGETLYQVGGRVRVHTTAHGIVDAELLGIRFEHGDPLGWTVQLRLPKVLHPQSRPWFELYYEAFHAAANTAERMKK